MGTYFFTNENPYGRSLSLRLHTDHITTSQPQQRNKKKTQRKYTIAKQSTAHKCHICNCTNRWCSLKFYHPRSKVLLTENYVKLSLMLYTMLLFHVQIISTN